MPYLAYLLRLWSSQEEDRQVWRASLENAHTAERHFFPDLDALFAFIYEETIGLSSADLDVEEQTE